MKKKKKSSPIRKRAFDFTTDGGGSLLTAKRDKPNVREFAAGIDGRTDATTKVEPRRVLSTTLISEEKGAKKVDCKISIRTLSQRYQKTRSVRGEKEDEGAESIITRKCATRNGCNYRQSRAKCIDF